MAHRKSVLLAGLLACIAASLLPWAAAFVDQNAAVYDCPDTPRMKGCSPTGCALHAKGRSHHLVCAQCLDDRAYVLVNGGTRKAACECAAGFAGKGQDGMCKKCPAGTDIAEGGPMSKSVCLKCPKGSSVNEQGTDCLCAAGHFRVVADQPAGYKKIACQPCQARNAYVPDEAHTKEACALCRIPMVANKEHTDCVAADHVDAAPGDGLLGSVSRRAADTPLGNLAAAFEEGRLKGQTDRLMRLEGRGSSPLKSLADRLRASTKREDKAEEEEPQRAELESEDPEAKPKAAPRDEPSKKRRHEKPQEDKVDPNLAGQLIPELPSEEAVAQQPKSAEAKPVPAGPVTLLDLAKKVGGAFGSAGPSRGGGNPLGFIDPSALADAGLPPVNNVGALMGALMKKQFGDLDMDEWKAGVRPNKDQY